MSHTNGKDTGCWIVYGLDLEEKPVAAKFPISQKDLVQKAAASLTLKCLAAEKPALAKVADQLPEGKILAAGRATVPRVSSALYQTLLAALPPALQLVPNRLLDHPASWKDICQGNLVLARDTYDTEAWYEAVILEQVDTDGFKLRFRDYPEEGIIERRRNELALLPAA